MTVKKMTLVSNHICFGMEPIAGQEAEQRFTINSKGQVWFSGYNFKEDLRFDLEKGRKIRKTTDPKLAAQILADTLSYFEHNVPFLVTDVGSFDLTIVFEDESKQMYHGPLFLENEAQKELCDSIRNIVDIENMFLFDGNNVWYDGDEEG